MERKGGVRIIACNESFPVNIPAGSSIGSVRRVLQSCLAVRSAGGDSVAAARCIVRGFLEPHGADSSRSTPPSAWSLCFSHTTLRDGATGQNEALEREVLVDTDPAPECFQVDVEPADAAIATWLQETLSGPLLAALRWEVGDAIEAPWDGDFYRGRVIAATPGPDGGSIKVRWRSWDGESEIRAEEARIPGAGRLLVSASEVAEARDGTQDVVDLAENIIAVGDEVEVWLEGRYQCARLVAVIGEQARVCLEGRDHTEVEVPGEHVRRRSAPTSRIPDQPVLASVPDHRASDWLQQLVRLSADVQTRVMESQPAELDEAAQLRWAIEESLRQSNRRGAAAAAVAASATIRREDKEEDTPADAALEVTASTALHAPLDRVEALVVVSEAQPVVHEASQAEASEVEVDRGAEAREDGISAEAAEREQATRITDPLAHLPAATAPSFPSSASAASRRAGNWLDEMALEIGQASLQEVENQVPCGESSPTDAAAMSALVVSEVAAVPSTSAPQSAGAGRAECPVCLDGSASDHALLPCGHCFCKEHAQRAAQQRWCHTCRQEPSSTAKLFF